MNGAEDFVEPKPMAHREHIFADNVASMLAHDGDAQDLVFTRHRQQFDKAFGCAFRDCSVELM